MTEQQAESRARKKAKPAFIFRLGTSWDASWGVAAKGERQYRLLKAGKLRFDKRTLRAV